MGLAVENGKVGNLVWVQRKNGRWWPGKIEASSNSKTAVKLLGKENGSLEWLNLANSKRVKAFRSVEFDDFIRSAELSNDDNFKKNAKYSKRKDAILHALSLEKQEQHRCLKRPGELKQSAPCRNKRTRCAYLPIESNSNVDPTVLNSQSMIVSSALWKLNKNSLASSHGEVQDYSKSTASDISESSSEGSGVAESGKITGSYTNGRKTSITNVLKKESFSNSSMSSHDKQFAGGDEHNWNLRERCCSHDSSGTPDMTQGKSYIICRNKAGNTKGQLIRDAGYLEEIKLKVPKKSSKQLALEVNSQFDSSFKSGDSCSESLSCDPVYTDDRNISKAMLVDVHIIVEANYRKEDVPLVSLMSKIGKVPIMGYPVEIEVLDNTPKDWLARKSSSHRMIDNVGSKLHQTIRKTSKRTPVSYAAMLKSSASQTPKAKKNDVLPVESSFLMPHRKDKFSLKNGHSCQASSRKKEGSISSIACVPLSLIFSKLFSAICT